MRILLSIILPVALIGCDQTTTSAPGMGTTRDRYRTEMPEDVYMASFNGSIAKQIASNCPTLAFNRNRFRKVNYSLSFSYSQSGYKKSDFYYLYKNIDKTRVQRDVINYRKRSGIVVGEAATYCEAGRREIAQSSQIGSFLKGA